MNEIELYNYDLPSERIAQEPAANRIDARLLIVNRSTGELEHRHIRDLPEILNPGDTLVMNNSQVVPARLVGYRTQTGGRWQGLFLREDLDANVWEVLTKTRGTLKNGETITIRDREARDGMQLEVISRTPGGNLICKPILPADWAEPAGTYCDAVSWLMRFGRVPLPPYIRDGQMVDSDVGSYQTVYAKAPGSVAAPTAGLHFTQSLLEKIRGAGVETCEVTLHVGIGTFRPIATPSLNEHEMHSEWGSMETATVDQISTRRKRGRCIAVGTTSVRVLESAAAANGGDVQPWRGETDLFIRPPYQFACVDALLTNFHLPKSSLLVLVSAFAGRELIMHAYESAIREEYRFFSYGDAMLIV